ncbi:11078_t:CDS:2, partial [Paraglomus occultum]
DLKDISEKLSELMTKLSEAEGSLADKYSDYRNLLKVIKTREASLREQRSKKESLWNKIEKEERKASHSKHPETFEPKITEYKEELERIENETMAAESALADFKREKFKEAITTQLDAFRLFAEKLNIITTSAKEVVDQLPLTPTKPGEPRPLYAGKEKTAQLVANAMAALAPYTTPSSTSHFSTSHPSPSHTSPSHTSASNRRLSHPPQSETIASYSHSFNADVAASAPPLNVILPSATHGTSRNEANLSSSYAQSEDSSGVDIIKKGDPIRRGVYEEDPNEADHSDLEQTDVEVEKGRMGTANSSANAGSKFKEVLNTPTSPLEPMKDSLESNQPPVSESTVKPVSPKLPPRPPTPGPPHAPPMSPDDENFHPAEALPISPATTNEAEKIIPILNEPVSPVEDVGGIKTEISEEKNDQGSAEVKTAEVKTTEEQKENSRDKNRLSVDHHGKDRHVSFSDVEDEIP